MERTSYAQMLFMGEGGGYLSMSPVINVGEEHER